MVVERLRFLIVVGAFEFIEHLLFRRGSLNCQCSWTFPSSNKSELESSGLLRMSMRYPIDSWIKPHSLKKRAEVPATKWSLAHLWDFIRLYRVGCYTVYDGFFVLTCNGKPCDAAVSYVFLEVSEGSHISNRRLLQLPQCRFVNRCNILWLFVVSFAVKPTLVTIFSDTSYLFWWIKTFRYSIPSDPVVIPIRTRMILIVSHTLPHSLVTRKY